MNLLLAFAVGAALLLITGISHAQDTSMMNSGMGGVGWMGGFGAMWLPILVVIAAVGIVAWFVIRKGK